MVTITIPKKIENELKSASRKFGLSKEDLLLNAVLYYFQVLEKKIELKKELDIWEKMSDIDLIEFEKSI